MQEKHVHQAQVIYVVGKGLHQELIAIIMVAEHIMVAIEQFVIGGLLIIFAKILLLVVELGD